MNWLFLSDIMVLVIAVVINTSWQTLSDLRNGVVCGKNTLLCDRAMIRWTCNVRSKDHISSDSLLRKLGINNIQTLLRYNRLRWFGHVVRNDGCINSITEFEVVGQRGRGRPKKTEEDMERYDQQSQTLEAIKGRSCKHNGVEKETLNKHRSRATHCKWN